MKLGFLMECHLTVVDIVLLCSFLTGQSNIYNIFLLEHFLLLFQVLFNKFCNYTDLKKKYNSDLY